MAAQGDLITFVGNCPALLLVRPSGNGQSFRLIGKAYLHGFMHGELWSPKYLEIFRDNGCTFVIG